MKVRDLITALGNVDPNLDVLCYTEDENLLAKGHMFLLLEIMDVQASDAERCRVDEVPYLKIGRSDKSERIAMITLTADF